MSSRDTANDPHPGGERPGSMIVVTFGTVDYIPSYTMSLHAQIDNLKNIDLTEGR